MSESARHRSIADVEDYARIAIDAAARATLAVESLERRVEELEQAPRSSRLADIDQRVCDALERLRSKSSHPPGLELQHGSKRVRGSSWAVVVVSVALVLFAALWQGPEIVRALR